MSIAKRALYAAAILAAIVATGCGGSDDESTATTAPTATENSAGVSRAEFDALQVGDSEADVRKQLGKPTAEQKTAVEDLGQGVCALYGKVGEPTYEICFVDGKLATKADF